MPHISLTCPYCQTKQAAFEGSSFQTFNQEATEFLTLMQCQLCRNAVVAKFKSPSIQNFGKWILGQAHFGPDVATLITTYPELEVFAAPLHTPPNVERFYLQGMDNLERNFDAAGTMFRKCLDTALKHIDPAGRGNNLEKRIEICRKPRASHRP